MNQHQLSYFIEVYKRKSISAAAAALYVSPQAVSKTISSLENELGISLFSHDKNKIFPTKEAANLALHASHILEEYDIIENKLFKESYISKSLKISCCFDAGLILGTDFFIEFANNHPEIKVQLRETIDTKIKNQLENGKIELAITSETLRPEKYVSIPLFTDSYYLIVNKNNSLAKNKEVSLSDLNGMKIISRDSTSADSLQHFNQLNQSGIQLELFLETTNSSFIVDLVSKNVGLAMLAGSLAKKITNPDIVAIPFKEKHLTKTLYLAYKQNTILSHEAECFRREISKSN